MIPVDTIVHAIRQAAFNYSNEKELQDGIEQILQMFDAKIQREHRLNERDIIDFLIDGIGLEIKIGSTVNNVIRQMHRYAQHEAVDSLVLVTTRARHVLPQQLNGKPCRVVFLWRQGL